MIICIYSTKDFERPVLEAAIAGKHEPRFISVALNAGTATLAAGCDAVSIFAGDDANAGVIEALFTFGVRYIAIRAAGYDNVHLETARKLGTKVANVPAYSPYAIAEHTIALMLAINRKIIIADRQVHQQDFRVGKLVGFDMRGKTVGIVGTGKIGGITARILHGFGCRLLGADIIHNEGLIKDCGMRYVGMDELCANSDIISLHAPLNKATAQLINRSSIALMRKGVMLINTGRGGLVCTEDVIDGLQSGRIGAYGADVYERERGIFFYDHSGKALGDPVLAQLLSLPNVLVTPHQAFATNEALRNIAETTRENLDCWQAGESSPNEL